MAEANPVNDEHRRQRRQRVLKGATILAAMTKSETQVVMRNMHADGAELSVPADVGVPADFLLYVPSDGVAYRAHVRWRRNGRVGVNFTGTEPKPRWHYG